jgi:hypothetical protein
MPGFGFGKWYGFLLSSVAGVPQSPLSSSVSTESLETADPITEAQERAPSSEVLARSPESSLRSGQSIESIESVEITDTTTEAGVPGANVN